jgi:hypothetical protein
VSDRADKGGLTRREMLQRSAAVVGVWAAPTILDAVILSPVSASGHGSLSFQYSKANNGNNNCTTGQTTSTGGTGCDPTGWVNGQSVTTNEVAIGMTTPATACGSSVAFTVPVGHTITEGIRCPTDKTAGVLSNSNRTITWSSGNDNTKTYRFVVTTP